MWTNDIDAPRPLQYTVAICALLLFAALMLAGPEAYVNMVRATWTYVEQLPIHVGWQQLIQWTEVTFWFGLPVAVLAGLWQPVLQRLGILPE
jgi:hypothetical protein